MRTEFGQTCADEQENFRISFKIYHERSNQLATIIQASNGLIIAVLVGVLAFAGSVKDFEQKPSFITLVIGLCVVSIILWRTFAHFVDNDIIRMYKKILYCECRLNIQYNISLLSNLMQQISEYGGPFAEELESYRKSGQYQSAYSRMIKLCENKMVGNRGHLAIDIIAGITCIFLIIFGGFLVYMTKSANPDGNYFIFGFVFGALFGIIVAMVFVYRFLPIARKPA